MKNSIDGSWKQLERWMQTYLPAAFEDLNSGASEDDICELEEIIGQPMPSDFRDSYRIHDGSGGQCSGVIFGFSLLSIDSILEQWISWKKVDRSMGSQMNKSCTSHPKDYIKNLYCSPLWVPITHDFAGNHLGIDLGPGTAGKKGQIINFGRDETRKFVLAGSFGEFLEYLVKELNSGNFIIEEGAESPVMNIKSPKVRHFLDAVPQIFGETKGQ